MLSGSRSLIDCFPVHLILHRQFPVLSERHTIRIWLDHRLTIHKEQVEIEVVLGLSHFLYILTRRIVMTSPSISSILFALPPEVREIIYAYLTPPSRLPTVLRSRHLGVSSVSHRPPPLDFLLINQQVYIEARDLYYRRCTFKIDGLLDPSNVWPLWQIEEVLGGTELGKCTLSRIRRLELNLFWHRLPGGGVANAALINEGGDYGSVYRSEVDKRVERLHRAVDVLKRAQDLVVVSVTWKEIPALKGEEQTDWKARERVMSALSGLGGMRGVRIIPGDIVADDEIEIRVLAFIQELNRASRTLEKNDEQILSHQPKEYVSTSILRSGIATNILPQAELSGRITRSLTSCGPGPSQTTVILWLNLESLDWLHSSYNYSNIRNLRLGSSSRAPPLLGLPGQPASRRDNILVSCK